MTNKPILAITMGDPGGIGPEIIAKALAHADVFDHSRPLVIGERRALEAAIHITGRPLEVRTLEQPAEAGEHAGIVDLIDPANIDIERVRRARNSAEGGPAAHEDPARATRLAPRA